jgi:predicted transcriptional regulator
MELDLPVELESRLLRVAEQRGIALDVLAREALERVADHEEWFVAEVEKGLAALDCEQFLSHEEVGLRLNRRFSASGRS